MSQRDHDHDHDHPHAEISHSERPGYYDMMETAVRELLIEKRLFGAEEIRRQIEVLDSRTPALGAKVVARAWVDPEFRARLLANGRSRLRGTGDHLLRRHAAHRSRKYRHGAQSHRLHPVLLLPAAGLGAAARLVQAEGLSLARGFRAPGRARRIRHEHTR